MLLVLSWLRLSAKPAFHYHHMLCLIFVLNANVSNVGAEIFCLSL